MKISDLEVIPVSVPFVEPFEIAGGKATHGRHVIIRLISKDGGVGYGESAPMSSYSAQTQESVIVEIKRLKGLLLGRDPLDIEAFHLAMGRVKADGFTLAGLDIALHDLAARTLGIPISRLIGGPVSEGVDLSWAIGFKPAEAMAREAKRYSDLGFGTIKIKVGDDSEVDVARVKAVREAVGPEVKIKVDANQGYDLETAIRVGMKLKEFDVSIMEQPLPRDALPELARLRKEIDIPVMVDESLYGPEDGMRIIKMGAADVFNIKIMKPGGLRPSSKLAAVAEAAGMPCMLGSMPELGVGTLAGLQLAVTSDVFTFGAELIGPWMFRDDLLVRKPRLEDGRLILPKGQGLGIKIDEGKLERFRCGKVL